MNTQELLHLLQSIGARPDMYDLTGGHLSERLTLGQRDGAWVVYYSERGLETGKKEFATEEEACDYLLAQVNRDPSSYLSRP